MYWFFPEHH